MGTPQTARNIPLGLPYEGMDLKTPLSVLPVSRAPYVENFFIDGQSLRVRNGLGVFSGITGSSSTQEITGLISYAKADGTSVLFGHLAMSGGGAGTSGVYDFSSATAVLSDTINYSSLYLTPVLFKNYLYYMDGNNQPRVYDGSVWANIGFTGPAFVQSFRCGNSYRNRLYLVEKDTTRVWYGGTDLISGAMVSFDIGSLLSKGGFLFNVYPISGNSGSANASDQYLALVSSEGEVLVYTGSYPGSPTFEIVSRFQIGKPLSTGSHVFYQGDTLVCTTTGLVSLRDCLRDGSNSGLYTTISQPIDNYWKSLMASPVMSAPIASLYVKAVFFAQTGCIYISFPVRLGRTDNKLTSDVISAGAILLVYNTLTGAWFQYIYGNDSTWVSICEHSRKLIAAPPTTRYVFELEKSGVFRDEIPAVLSTYREISANLLSPCISSSRDSGNRQKFNALELYAYINAGSATDPVQCYLVENFGKVTGTTKPAIIEDDFNSIPLNVGSSREYVQYSLTVKTNSSSGDPTVLYNLNALIEQGGYR